MIDTPNENVSSFRSSSLFRYLIAATTLYFLFAVFGITTSHTSTLFGSADEKSHVILGEARQQRSDEFLRGSPRVVGSLRQIKLANYTPFDYTGSPEFQKNQTSPLARVNYYLAPINEIVVDQAVKLLPLEMAFSLLWWQNIWLLFVAVPVWFVLLGRRPEIGALTALLVFFSVSNNWFSYLPSNLIAQSVASACLVMIALKLLSRRRVLSSALAILLAIYAGRFAFTVIQYPPWGIPIILMVAVVTALQIFNVRDRWQVIRYLLVVLCGGALATLCVYVYNRQLYDVALTTVYPGQRRDSGGNNGQGLWSGGLAWFFQSTFARRGGFANPEVILGPTFVVIPTIFLLVNAYAQDLIDRRLRQTVTTLVVGILILICWSQVNWPKWALFLNPLVFVPAARADQILGILVLFPLVLILSSKAQIQIRTSVCVMATLLTIAIASRDMQSIKLAFLPESGEIILTFSMVMVAVITYCLLRFRSFFAKTLPLVILIIGSSVLVNPLVSGLGALGESDAVKVIRTLGDSAPNGRWATNGYFQDALMISTGVPQLSGQQPYGPNMQVWRKIDTQNKFEDNWNRGQAYIQFVWDPRKDVAIWNPSPDVIQVVINPCDSRLQDVQLHWVMSSIELSYSCLVKKKQIEWMGLSTYVYQVLNSKMFNDRDFDFSK